MAYKSGSLIPSRISDRSTDAALAVYSANTEKVLARSRSPFPSSAAMWAFAPTPNMVPTQEIVIMTGKVIAMAEI